MQTCLSRLWIIGLWTLCGLTACGSDHSDEPPVQFPASTAVLGFDSLNFAPSPIAFASNSTFLRGEPGTVVRLTGDLELPGSNEARLPAIILMHGAGGVVTYQRQWVTDLMRLGLATFTVDSLTGRGLAGVNTVWTQPRIVDAYDASGDRAGVHL